MVQKYLLESIRPSFLSGVHRGMFKLDNYQLILSQVLLHYTGSGGISLVRPMKWGREGWGVRVLLLAVEGRTTRNSRFLRCRMTACEEKNLE